MRGQIYPELIPSMNDDELKNIIEAALLAAGRPLSVEHLEAIFEEDQRPERDMIRQMIDELNQEYESRGIEIQRVASGFRLQVKKELAPWVSRLWEERPARYTRALARSMAQTKQIRAASVLNNAFSTGFGRVR